jgi:hypothetical protein
VFLFLFLCYFSKLKIDIIGHREKQLSVFYTFLRLMPGVISGKQAYSCRMWNIWVCTRIGKKQVIFSVPSEIWVKIQIKKIQRFIVKAMHRKSKKWLHFIRKRSYSLGFNSESSFLHNNFLITMILQKFRATAYIVL